MSMYREGVFATTINSLKILYASISNFRHLNDEDMEAVRIYREMEKQRKEKQEMMQLQRNEQDRTMR